MASNDIPRDSFHIPTVSSTFRIQSNMIKGFGWYRLQYVLMKRTPLFFTLVLFTSIIRGGKLPGPISLSLSLGGTIFLQYLAGFIGSLMIMPSANTVVDTLISIANNRTMQYFYPSIKDQLRDSIRSLTAMRASLSELREYLLNEGGQHIQITCLDNTVLDGIIFNQSELTKAVKDNRWGSSTTGDKGNRNVHGVFLYLAGNGEMYERKQDLPLYYRKFNMSIMMINYRGVGLSTNTISRNGAVMDVCSAIAYLHYKLEVPLERIVLIGHSIGGGYASEAIQFFPQVKYINDRSFSRLSAAASNLLLRIINVQPDSPSTKAVMYRYFVYYLMNYIVCWELDSSNAWSSIGSDQKAIVSSPADGIIPPFAQLHNDLIMRGVSSKDIGYTLVMNTTGYNDGNMEHNRDWNANEVKKIEFILMSLLYGQRLGS